jgi:hypothetical protein
MASVRDVAIVVLAIESIIVGILLAILTIQVSRLVRMLRQEIRPMLDATQETVGTVRGTATFLSEHLVSPVVNIAGTISGLRQAAKTLAGFRSGGRDGTD